VAKQGRISFPLSKALAFSARSVRIRLGRMLVVIMGVASAIAFVIVLLSLDLILKEITARAGGKADALDKLRSWWIAVALLISVTGITNAILMSVTERIKEIGTIRCLGAMSRHIVEIFLFEAMFLGMVGGFVGGIAGLGITYAYSVFSYGWTIVQSTFTLMEILKLMGIAMGLSMGLCVISAIYPVYFAARLEPADAMRYEV
jgi:hypothetical protein